MDNSSIPEGEKSILRQKLIGHIHEPVLQVATQLAIIISKIARFDFFYLITFLYIKYLFVAASQICLYAEQSMQLAEHKRL